MSAAGGALDDDALRRVEALVGAARLVADPSSDFGRRARALLVESTGLSAENVELALTECLETAPSRAELDALIASVPVAPRAHVVLPANVFIAAHRALALALASAPHVFVRPSRREPHFAALLAAAAPNLFSLTPQIQPESGDHVWAYGGDTSLDAIRASLPPDVHLHAHGPGYGVAVIDASQITAETATALAADIVPFDQRGCLSPRAAIVEGTLADARRFADLVARALADAGERIPRGRLDAAELADARAWQDAHTYSGSVIAAGPGAVSVAENRWEPAPIGRNLLVMSSDALIVALQARGADITAIGVTTAEHRQRLERFFPYARIARVGTLQRPAFDGPVDRRH